MGGLEIGITGLRTAQNALDIIGNNIANAATEGYHRQTAVVSENDDLYTNGIYLGQGADVEYVKRNVNWLLDQEINTRTSDLSQLDRELQSLLAVESAFGELATGGITTALDNFYGALRDLSQEPTLVVYQSEVISTATTLTNQFRNVAQVVGDLEDRTFGEAQEAVEDINQLAVQIADMNREIYQMMVKGDTPNNLLDRRDAAITTLSEIVDLTTYQREFGVVDISLGDVPLVTNYLATEIEAGLVQNGTEYDLGVRIKDSATALNTNITGGRLGGLFSLKNSILRDIGNSLDSVARNIIFETNKYHIEGVGSDGSFSNMTGWYMDTTTLADMDPPVQNGALYIRAQDASGNLARGSIAVNVTGTSLSDVALDITNMTFDFGGGPVQPLQASVTGGKLEIGLKAAFADYKFDFLPGALDTPTTSTLTNGPGGELPPNVSVSGVYTGTADNTYTITVAGSADGYLGTGDLALQVSDLSGPIKSINVGAGYELGTRIEIDEGIYVTLSANTGEPGFLNVGEDFTIDVIASSDTSGVLKAAGMNAFFKGTNAATIGVSENVESQLGKIAVSIGAASTDNGNCLRMAALSDTDMTDLDGLTQKQYYSRLATDVGSQISTTKLKQENTFGVWRSLNVQRDDTSGVDVNDEAAKMLMFERMYQSMARYMRTVNDTMGELMNLVR